MSSTMELLHKKQGTAPAVAASAAAELDTAMDQPNAGHDTNGATNGAAEVAEATPAAAPAAEVATVTKPKGKKTKGVAVVKAGATGEILPPDLISDTVKALENLKAADVPAMIKGLLSETDFADFKLGGVLQVVQTNGWFGEYDNFKAYVEAEFGISYRKAAYLSSTYRKLVESGVSWAAVSKVGWTKLKEIASILTPENAAEWVKKAEANSTNQLIEMVNAANGKGGNATAGTGTGTGDVATVKTKTFKFHADQLETVKSAIEKAKVASGTEGDATAMEFIAIEYLNNGTSKAGASAVADTSKEGLAALFKKLEMTPVLEAFELAFPDVGLTVVLPETA